MLLKVAQADATLRRPRHARRDPRRREHRGGLHELRPQDGDHRHRHRRRHRQPRRRRLPDQTWTSAGGAANNTLVKLIVYYEDAAADATRIPLTAHDFAVTTDGSDLTAQVATAGFYRAT